MPTRKAHLLLRVLVLSLVAGGCVMSPETAFEEDKGYFVPLYEKGSPRSRGNFEVIKSVSVTIARKRFWTPVPTRAAVEAGLRIAAREVKADAVIDVEISEPYVGLSGKEQSGKGKAIKYK